MTIDNANIEDLFFEQMMMFTLKRGVFARR
jgi:hypothetical protein